MWIARTLVRSLVKLAFEQIAFEKGRVFDSLIGARSSFFLDDKNKPKDKRDFAILYTDTSEILDPEKNQVDIDLIVEFGSGAFEIQVSDGSPPVLKLVPESDAAAEIRADIVAHKIHYALTFLNNEWSEHLRSLTDITGRVTMLCGADERGIHSATRGLRIPLRVKFCPVYGEKLKGAWNAAVMALESYDDDEKIRAVGRIIRKVCEGEHPVEETWAEIENLSLTRSDTVLLDLDTSFDWDRFKPATIPELTIKLAQQGDTV